MPYFPKRSKKNNFNNFKEDFHDDIYEFKKTLNSYTTIDSAKKKLYEKHPPFKVKSNLKDFDKKVVLQKDFFVKNNNFYFSLKNVFDEFSFGLSNIQFLNIILFLLLPSYFILGLVFSVKVFLKQFFENNYDFFISNFEFEKKKVYFYGNVIGFSLIFLGIAATFKIVWLYIFTFIIIGVFSSLYIKGSKKLLSLSTPKDKRSHFLKFVSYYGLILTSFTMLIAGLILDSYNNVFFKTFFIPNYTLMFFISGVLFIISSYMITQIKNVKSFEIEESKESLKSEFSSENSFFKKLFFVFEKNLSDFYYFKNNKSVFLKRMLFAGILFFSIQLSLNYILGLYFFELFNSFFLVSLLLASTIITSFLIPLFFDPKSLRKKGKSLILVLGVSLALILPLLLTFINFFVNNSSNFFNGLTLLYFIVAISGSSVAGVAFSRLNFDVLRVDDRKRFFSALGFGINIFSILFLFLVFFLKEFFSFGFSFLFITIVYFIILFFFGKSLNSNEEEKYQKSLLNI